MKSERLIWDNWNREHIKKHGVSEQEAETVANDQSSIRMKTYGNRLMVLGITRGERLLTVILSYEKQKNPYVVSARDMSKKERKIYHAATETN